MVRPVLRAPTSARSSLIVGSSACPSSATTPGDDGSAAQRTNGREPATERAASTKTTATSAHSLLGQDSLPRSKGQLVWAGPPQDVIRHPSSSSAVFRSAASSRLRPTIRAERDTYR